MEELPGGREAGVGWSARTVPAAIVEVGGSSTIRPEEDRSSDSVHADVEHGGRTPVLMGASLVKARFANLENRVGCNAFRRLSARAWFLAECRFL